MNPVVEQIEIVDLSVGIKPGDYGSFVGIHSGRQCGWYGPVSKTVATYVERNLSTITLGWPVFDHRALLDRFRLFVAEGTSQSDAKSQSWAIGAIDCAMWDLHGKIVAVPTANLLADQPSSSVAAYASWLRFDQSAHDAACIIAKVAAEGWAFTKWGLRRQVGDNASRMRSMSHRVAQAAGGRAAFDALGTWDLESTVTFARDADLGHIIWLEDPLPTELSSGYDRLASLETLSLALGEHLLIADSTMSLFSYGNRVTLTFDVVGCGGLTRAVELMTTARRHGMSIVPHGRSLVPALHLAAAHRDVVPCVEYQLQWEPRRQSLYTTPRSPDHGHIWLGESAGLGVTPRRIDAS